MPIPIFGGMPDTVAGYELNPGKGFFSVVIPAGRTNKIKNPSLEKDTTGYIAVGGSITRTADWQAKGTFSLKVTPGAGVNDGVYYGDSNVLSLTISEQNWFSFYFKGDGGLKYKAYFATTAGAQLGTAFQFTATGYEQRITLNYTETATNNRRLYIVKDNDTNVQPFYVDALQVEVGSYPTTYLDGSMVGLSTGLTDYYWKGAAHSSESVRLANSTDGGQVVNLLDLGFQLTGIMGLGLGGINNIFTPLSTGGSLYQKTIYQDRQFSLIGDIFGNGLEELQTKRQALIDALNANRVSPQQPLKLLYTPANCSVGDIGRTLEIACLFDQGLPGQIDNLNHEKLSLDFHLYTPYSARSSIDQGTTLLYESYFQTNRFAWVDENGDWSGEQIATGGTIYTSLVLPDGTWAIGGSLVDAGGDANADYLFRYNPETKVFSSFNATPLNGQVTTLVLLPNGKLGVGGAFTNAGGDANANYLCQMDLTTGAFSSFNATPLNQFVNIAIVLPDGNLAVGGGFTNAGGDANADYLCKLNLTTMVFSSFNATPLNNTVQDLKVDLSNNLVIGGLFTDAGGDANADKLCRMNLSTLAFTIVVAGVALNNTVRRICITPTGDYLIAGFFTNVNGDANASYIIGFNGTSYYALGSGLDNTVSDVILLDDGTFLVGGSFSRSGNISFANGIAIWNGDAWIIPDLLWISSGTVLLWAMQHHGSGRTSYFADSSVAFGLTAYRTQINNIGTFRSFPTFVIRGPGQVVSLKNLTTGDELLFNLALRYGEEITISFYTDGVTLISNFQGNLFSSVIPGSRTQFSLSMGINNISLFVAYNSTATGFPITYIVNDGSDQINEQFFFLQGVTNLNSDNGTLYLNIVDVGGGFRRIDIYKDSARTQLVAQTSATYNAASPDKSLVAQNSSGISGKVRINSVGAADSDIIIGFPVAMMSWTPAFDSIDGAIRPRLL